MQFYSKRIRSCFVTLPFNTDVLVAVIRDSGYILAIFEHASINFAKLYWTLKLICTTRGQTKINFTTTNETSLTAHHKTGVTCQLIGGCTLVSRLESLLLRLVKSDCSFSSTLVRLSLLFLPLSLWIRDVLERSYLSKFDRLLSMVR